MNISAEDREQFGELLSQLPGPVNESIQITSDLIKKQRRGELNTLKGVSFLDVKNHLLLSYIMNLTHLMCEKMFGKSISESSDVDRLIEIRTVLEKMRPIDRKLKYQIDKLIRTAKTGANGGNAALSLKPNPDNFADNADEDEDADTGATGDGAELKQIYKPARLAPVYYDGDESMKEKKEKQMEKAKKRLANSAIVRDLHREYTDAPEEIQESTGSHRMKEDQSSHERQEYEEKYFIRMSTTKQEKTAARQRRLVSGLDSLTNFGNVGLLTGQNKGTLKKRKKSFRGKHKGSSKKRKIRK